ANTASNRKHAGSARGSVGSASRANTSNVPYSAARNIGGTSQSSLPTSSLPATPPASRTYATIPTAGTSSPNPCPTPTRLPASTMPPVKVTSGADTAGELPNNLPSQVANGPSSRYVTSSFTSATS